MPATPACTSLVAADLDAAIEMVAQLLAYLPQHNDEEPPRWPTDDPPDRQTPEAGELIPPTSTGSYDVREVIRGDLSTTASCSSCAAAGRPTSSPRSPRSAGLPIGIVANQPMALAGTLDIPASQKAARFVAFCDAFNLPILTLVDTPGFYPGKDLEWRGMIRHGAQLVFAYGRATVPRICVILRKSYGGAYIVMDSKTMGNDLCLAWPWAELAVMGAGQAAAILQRRATPEERAAFEADYAERLLNPYIAAERGYIDAVIEPAETRQVIAEALMTLIDKREALGFQTPRQHPPVGRAGRQMPGSVGRGRDQRPAEQSCRCGAIDGFREPESLRRSATHPAQELQLRGALDALRDDLESEPLPDVDDHLDELRSTRNLRRGP